MWPVCSGEVDEGKIPHLDDVLSDVMGDGGSALRAVSLPRRDGQGHRRGVAVMLLALLGLLSACHGAVSEPVDHAEHAPPTQATIPPPSGSPRPRGEPEPFVAGTFDEAVVGEASGVAASVRNPGWVYVLDDGPGADGVVAVDTIDGTSTRIVVDGLEGRDTEGLAVAGCSARPRSQPCLFIGDIGNNAGRWTSVDVWRVREPRLRGARRVPTRGTRATYTYGTAPVDAEALLVDDGRPYLVTKERLDRSTGQAPPPRLLAADSWGGGVLHDLGTIDLPDPTVGLAAAAVGNVVTGGDAGAGVVVLRTYDHVVVYTPPAPGAPLDTLATWSAREVRGIPGLPQPEGIAVDACGLWLVSERVDSVWLAPWTPASSDEVEEHTCPSGDGRS